MPAEAPRRCQRFFRSTIGFRGDLFGRDRFLIVYGSFTGAQNMGYNWQWYRVPQYHLQLSPMTASNGARSCSSGWCATIQLSATAFVLATLLGLHGRLAAAFGLGRRQSAVAVGFLEFIRNIPLLVLLYLFYYVLGPIFGFDRYYCQRS